MKLSPRFLGCICLSLAFISPAIFQSSIDCDNRANFCFLPRTSKVMYPSVPTELSMAEEIEVQAGSKAQVLPLFNGGDEAYNQAYKITNPYSEYEFYLQIAYDNALSIEGCIPGEYTINITSFVNENLSQPLKIVVTPTPPESIAFSLGTSGSLAVGSKGKIYPQAQPYYASENVFYSSENENVLSLDGDEYTVVGSGKAIVNWFIDEERSGQIVFDCISPSSNPQEPTFDLPTSVRAGDILDLQLDYHGGLSEKGSFEILKGHGNGLIIGNRFITKRDGRVTIAYLSEAGETIASADVEIVSPRYAKLVVYLTAYYDKDVVHFYDITADIPTVALTRIHCSFALNCDDILHHPTIEYSALNPEAVSVDQYGTIVLRDTSIKTYAISALRHEMGTETYSNRDVSLFYYWGQSFGIYHTGVSFAFFVCFSLLPGVAGAWVSFAFLDVLMHRSERKKSELILSALLFLPSLGVWTLACTLALKAFDLGILATLYLSMLIGFWLANGMRKLGKHKHGLERTDLSI